MSLEQQIEIVKNLGNLGKDIPGLDSDDIINNLVDKNPQLESYNLIVEEERKDNMDRGDSKEKADKEAEEKIKEVKEKIKDNIRPAVEEEIANIKIQYKIFSEGLETIPADVKSTIANIILPPAIAVPAAAPNPVYALNLTKTSKNTLSGILNRIILAFSEVIKSATKISFVLPQSLLVLYNQLKVVDDLINGIPL